MTEATTQQSDRVLKMLREQFPGVVSITPGQALEVSGLTRASNFERAAQMAIHRKTFPFPVVQTGRNRRVLLTAIADVMARASTLPSTDDAGSQTPSENRPGTDHPDMLTQG